MNFQFVDEIVQAQYQIWRSDPMCVQKKKFMQCVQGLVSGK